ncbi:zinc transport system substrate-binding protein [Ruegeria intermedia]|uniref:High-affinity zinc uptake system protein ZnuA n=1 Tax=Ruegeria intermedia TaxID=996115 RepID=A0A1M4XII0_9RHOB|nr:zinc ABC transporter substrate-binding protein [Ruegeria intermedia]SHE93364.1 zinc transport system substrate-binding protein [Ruegeria intermedia]
MSRTLVLKTIAAVLLGGAAMADAPRVAVDIAPVHSLVARVMAGVGSPDLIVPPGASPHEYNLRPSEAAALQEADLVFWMGEDLTPWLEGAIDSLAGGATVTTLLDSDGTQLLDIREGALFEAHDHDDHADQDDHADHEGHDHADHDDHADHEGHDHADHDDHGHEDEHDDHHADRHGHSHGAHDPHAWLSPQNAQNWLTLIAAQLSAADPENAGAYYANATAAQEDLSALTDELTTMLAPVRGGRFIVFHDAYQYFEHAFDFPASGAISVSDATDPSPARLAEIRARIRDEGVDCVLTEPQFNPGLVATVLEGSTAETAVLDPLGATLEPGADLYPQTIRNIARTLADCLSR